MQPIRFVGSLDSDPDALAHNVQTQAESTEPLDRTQIDRLPGLTRQWVACQRQADANHAGEVGRRFTASVDRMVADAKAGRKPAAKKGQTGRADVLRAEAIRYSHEARGLSDAAARLASADEATSKRLASTASGLENEAGRAVKAASQTLLRAAGYATRVAARGGALLERDEVLQAGRAAVQVAETFAAQLEQASAAKNPKRAAALRKDELKLERALERLERGIQRTLIAELERSLGTDAFDAVAQGVLAYVAAPDASSIRPPAVVRSIALPGNAPVSIAQMFRPLGRVASRARLTRPLDADGRPQLRERPPQDGPLQRPWAQGLVSVLQRTCATHLRRRIDQATTARTRAERATTGAQSKYFQARRRRAQAAAECLGETADQAAESVRTALATGHAVAARFAGMPSAWQALVAECRPFESQ